VCIFCVIIENIKTDLCQIFSGFKRKLFYYNLHSKALHLAFKSLGFGPTCILKRVANGAEKAETTLSGSLNV